MSIFDRVKVLNFPAGCYAVFGSGPMEAHGLRPARDVDIIVTTEFYLKCKKDSLWTPDQLRDHHPVLKHGDVSLYDSWAPDSWDIPQMIKEAELMQGIPFVRLETVLEWKKTRNSDKDKADIKLIEAFLKKK
jgi:hypothetical protein